MYHRTKNPWTKSEKTKKEVYKQADSLRCVFLIFLTIYCSLMSSLQADVLRLLILRRYGGIYLDNDIYVVNSLDKYRR